MEHDTYPMRINKYLAHRRIATRREADTLIEAGAVFINGRRAKLGDQVHERDTVDVKGRRKDYRYFAFHKPRGVITHSPQEGEKEIGDIAGIPGVFPIGRLDKDSRGLIILTDDGRITDSLLNPKNAHDKEYRVRTTEEVPETLARRMEPGVVIEGYRTKPCRIRVLGTHAFTITLTEGKKHQVRRMCAALGLTVADLMRTRIMNIKLGTLPAGSSREITGSERDTLLRALGI
jgi:23S rRNA pseudouridine2604 synthase